jgi:hypothetical protein
MKTKLPLLAVGSALLLIGCYVDRPRGYVRSPAVEASYSYVYYPDAEVYYEPQRHVYYWADGGAWRSGPRVPQNIVLRSSVRVNLDSPEPYRHHEEVRAQHPRHLEEKQPERGH